MKPIYIFDLDGTLVDISHRRHFVENRANRWDEFHRACVDDTPIQPICDIANTLITSGAHVCVFSGRSDMVITETIAQIQWIIPGYHSLVMRRAGDYTPDDVLKESWLNGLSPEDRARLVCTFDDRDRVVAMWRRNGIVCCQVAPGNF